MAITMNTAMARTPDHAPPPFDPRLPPAERCRRLSDGLPEPLRRTLAAGRIERRPRFRDDGFDGIAETWLPPDAVTPRHADLARQVSDDLVRTVLAPADPGHLLARILALLSHFPAKGMTPEVEQMIALDWAEDLGEFPGWAIDQAARSWRRTRKWRPSIVEMRALCEEACAQERALLTRLGSIARAGAGGTRQGTVGTLVDGAVRRMP